MRISNQKLTFGKLKATLLLWIGVADVFFFGVGIIIFADICLTDKKNEWAALLVCLCFAAFGVWLIRSGVKKNRLVKDCKRYAYSLTNSENASVEKLAAVLGENPGMVRKNLEKMIGHGYIENVYLDNSADRFVILDGASKSEEVRGFASDTVLKQQEMVRVTCPNCGGTTALPEHSVGTCDYCGSEIRSK